MKLLKAQLNKSYLKNKVEKDFFQVCFQSLKTILRQLENLEINQK